MVGGPPGASSSGVRRLRAVLEHHGGSWSSEHRRVHAQGFLGDDNRLECLRAALRADAGNALCAAATWRARWSRGGIPQGPPLSAPTRSAWSSSISRGGTPRASYTPLTVHEPDVDHLTGERGTADTARNCGNAIPSPRL